MLEKIKIYPRCKGDQNQIYISAEGIAFNCCWIGNMPHMEDYFKFHGEDIDRLNLNKISLSEIMQSNLLEKVEKSWDEDGPFAPCVKFCSRQIVVSGDEMMGTNVVNKVSLQDE